jgi:hypothetical protein
MSPDSRKFVIEVLEALADKCTRTLLLKRSELSPGQTHEEARGVRDQCLIALHEVEQL